MNTTRCIPCPEGFFTKTTRREECNPCGSGSSTEGLTGAASCVDCPAGTYGDNCTKCAVGKYRGPGDKDTTKCKDCPNGYYQEQDKQASCPPCLPGRYNNKTGMPNCSLCAIGQMSASASAETCSDCFSGKTSDVGSSFCDACTAGQYLHDYICKSCPEGWSSMYGQRKCQACTPGKYAGGYNTTTRKEATSCVFCPAGKHGETGLTAAVRLNETKACRICPAGTFSAASGVESASGCNRCPPGTFSASTGNKHPNNCSECPQDMFNEDAMQSACKSCRTGMFTDGRKGQTVCSVCVAGKQMRGLLVGNRACVACAPGNVSTSPGTNCSRCDTGTFSNPARTKCLPCPKGTWGGGGPGQPNETAACRNCPRGKYSSAEGALDILGCISCSPGRHSNALAATASTACTKCTEGTFQALEGNTTCSTCPAGYENVQDGSTVCTVVPRGSYSNASNTTLKCEAGFKCAGADHGREPCPPGYYASNPGSVDCFPCAPGKYARLNASTTCTTCPSGWLQDKEGKANCIKPAFGSIAAGGSSSVVIAKGWTAIDCSEDGVCNKTSPCAPGTFDNGTHACALCPAGWSSDEGKTACDVCEKGKATKTLGTACEECPAGWFQDQNTKPSLACKQCPSGYDYVKDSDGNPANGSALCRDLNYILRCSSEQYLNDTSDDPGDYACEPCPPGGACGESAETAWSSLGPLFGWWKIPVADRAGNASWKSTAAFVECTSYPPACLGAPNRALANRFYSESRVDLAMIEKDNNQTTTCSVALGFRNTSRLCHTCNATSRRLGIGRCTKCPDSGQNWGLMALGCIVALFVLVFIVGSTIRDAGKQTLSSAVQKIILNYLQVAALAQAFPLRWPRQLETLFEFQSAVSTVGEALINPDCVTTSSSAAQLFYSKQAGFAAMPFVAVFFSFIFWFVYGCVKKTPFFAKKRKRGGRKARPPGGVDVTRNINAGRLSLGTTLRMASMLKGKANAAKRAISYHTSTEEGPHQGRRYSYNQKTGVTKWTTNSLSNASGGEKKEEDAKPPSSPKDKFVVTVTVVVYLIFPTLCKQAFQIFDCKSIAGVQYLAVDMEHPCYTDAHMTAVLTLGIAQLAVFVVGLPLLVLFFLRRNRRMQGGLNRRRVKVRYGLFFSAYDDTSYYWEIVLTVRKISIVALSVFGRSIGTQRQAQMVLFILFVCISLEISGEPYRIVTQRHKILGHLELTALFSLWATMWCGTLIFASQAPGDEGFVVFLSFVVAVINVCVMLWLFLQLIAECIFEHKSSKVVTSVRRRMKSIGLRKHSLTGKQSHRFKERVAPSHAPSHAASGKETGIELTTVNSVAAALGGGSLQSRGRTTPQSIANLENPLYRGKGVKPSACAAAELVEGGSNDPIFTEGATAAGETTSVWIREFDDASARFYLHNEVTGESTWEKDEAEGQKEDASTDGVCATGPTRKSKRYSKFTTDDGDDYYVPEAGEGETLWYLPEDADVVP